MATDTTEKEGVPNARALGLEGRLRVGAEVYTSLRRRFEQRHGHGGSKACSISRRRAARSTSSPTG